MKKFSSLTIWIIVLMLMGVSAMFLLETNKSNNSIAFNEFQQEWKQNNIKSIEVKEDGMTVEGVLNSGKTFVTIVPSTRLYQFIGANENTAITESYEEPTTLPGWISIIPTVILIIMLFGLWFMFMQQAQGGGGGNRGVMNFGKSKAKMATPDSRKVTFNDVAGADEEKEELAEIVDFLKNSKKYIDVGARIPK